MCEAGNKLRATKQINCNDFKILPRENVSMKVLCAAFEKTVWFLKSLQIFLAKIKLLHDLSIRETVNLLYNYKKYAC